MYNAGAAKSHVKYTASPPSNFEPIHGIGCVKRVNVRRMNGCREQSAILKTGNRDRTQYVSFQFKTGTHVRE